MILRTSRARILLGAAASTAVLGALVAPSADAAGTLTTFLLSRSAAGGFPNGPSAHPEVSHDQRIATYMAYQSDASDIVANDTNNTTDVFVVQRQGPFASNGTEWTPGPSVLVSTGMDGQPANGPSTLPSVDGDSRHNPHCVAFVSAASNLVPGDTNGVPDAFVKDLKTGTITRVSVNSAGEQADGPTTAVSIDGACERVAFTAQANNLALTSTTNKSWKTSVTTGSGGRKQVYVHVMSGTGANAPFTGLTFLASANKGQAANADADEPSFAIAGRAVVFSTTASNLSANDRNGLSDVYKRTFVHDFDKGAQRLLFTTVLASTSTDGKTAGNGSSSAPDVTDGGQFVVFQTTASNILPGDTNGKSDIVEMDLDGTLAKSPDPNCSKIGAGRVVCAVSKSKATTFGNGDSSDPSVTDSGEFVLFVSDATNLKESSSLRDDANGVSDVFVWNRPTGNVSLQSRGAPSRPGAKGDYLTQPSFQPATSARGNYVPFVTTDTAADFPLLQALGIGAPAPSNDLVYVRYLGTA